MAENKPSSQESLPLSQETYQHLFSLIERPLSNLMDDNSEISQEQDETYDLINNMSRRDQIGFNVVQSIDFSPIAIPIQHLPQRPISCLPASENWPGYFQFSVSFYDQNATKGVSWIFSHELNKLYVSKGVPCPVNFSTANCMTMETYIRAMVLFSSSDHANEIVTRCVNHSIEEINREIFEAEHFVRCESQNAHYENDAVTGRHSVIVPYENPPAGQLFSTYLFKFMCFGSCSGGPNRRPLMIVFTLERRGEVIGRQRIDLKVCACPVRDFKADNKANVPNNKPIKRPTEQLLVEKKIKRDDQKAYKIEVKDKKCYRFLKKMQALYTLHSAVKDTPNWKQFFNVSSQSSSGEETDRN